MKSIVKGRQELLAFLKKRKHSEIHEKDLFSKRLRLKHTLLGVHFHLRDLLGRGCLTKVQSAAGVFFRLAQAEGL